MTSMLAGKLKPTHIVLVPRVIADGSGNSGVRIPGVNVAFASARASDQVNW